MTSEPVCLYSKRLRKNLVPAGSARLIAVQFKTNLTPGLSRSGCRHLNQIDGFNRHVAIEAETPMHMPLMLKTGRHLLASHQPQRESSIAISRV